MILVKGEVVRGHHAYTVEKLVGSGAYAAVYRARDEVGRVVALKEYFPASHPRDAKQLRSLWERERYVLTQVSPHPLMPSFYDAFEAKRQLYIAQEFIEGPTLADIIQRYKKIDREWRLKWAVNLCDALTYLHDRCIVHHDLKPANLKITPEGHLCVLDYGAAQYFGDQKEGVPDAFQADGELYGTEGYLPPEVEETFAATVQTDIFALGCILYEMVMGVPPEQQRLNERNTAVTTPLMQRRDVDLEYVKLVSTALSYNTEYRYSSAQSFLQALRHIAPPVTMVSHKNLYFGPVGWNQTNALQNFSIYNAGTPTEMVGEIVCKVPWLRVVESSKFRGKRRDVAIVCDPRRAPAQNVPIQGEVEIYFSELRGPEGDVLSRPDHWVIHCYATVKATPARLEFVPSAEASNAGSAPVPAPVTVRSMRGVTGKQKITLRNSGELQGTFDLAASDPTLGLSVAPSSICVPGGGSAAVELRYAPPPTAAPGQTPVATSIAARMNGNAVLTVPVSLATLSPVEYARATLTRGR